ncbi:HAMP domain-containing sensor histidine kinase [uncultured Anaerococcus sp.]|uniref:sensor histidine kinase n=1 Tax=uncultured Anaerococcus sp. TaxID=293428 RepID=UPI0025D7215A|nr:sensor histidine kinase [uncultured Anaerococcus sp.]
MSKFIKIKGHSLILFVIFILALLASITFGFDKNYISYICLISVFLFLIDLVISYRNFKRFSNEITYWTNDFESKAPFLIENTKAFENINNIYKSNKQMENFFEIKMAEFKEYVSMWTHQVKTPLFSLNLILKDHPVDDHAAKAEVFEIEEYIETLLSYMRLESLSTDFVFEQADLDELISSSIKKYSKVFIKKKNKVNFVPTNLKLTTDRKWFALILDQILSNSNKYTQEGEISFYIDDKNLIIEDTGIGIRKEDLPRVFDKSYTGYNGRIYKKSTGIGLNLVKIAAENLSIDVSIESKVDVGTKVILNLSRVLK